MDTLQNRLGKKELLIAAGIVLALAGCGTSQKQAPPTTATVAPAPEAAAAPSAKEIRAKSSALRAQMSPENGQAEHGDDSRADPSGQPHGS